MAISEYKQFQGQKIGQLFPKMPLNVQTNSRAGPNFMQHFVLTPFNGYLM